jgi:hypothetical protein
MLDRPSPEDQTEQVSSTHKHDGGVEPPTRTMTRADDASLRTRVRLRRASNQRAPARDRQPKWLRTVDTTEIAFHCES